MNDEDPRPTRWRAGLDRVAPAFGGLLIGLLLPWTLTPGQEQGLPRTEAIEQRADIEEIKESVEETWQVVEALSLPSYDENDNHQIAQRSTWQDIRFELYDLLSQVSQTTTSLSPALRERVDLLFSTADALDEAQDIQRATGDIEPEQLRRFVEDVLDILNEFLNALDDELADSPRNGPVAVATEGGSQDAEQRLRRLALRADIVAMIELLCSTEPLACQ